MKYVCKICHSIKSVNPIKGEGVWIRANSPIHLHSTGTVQRARSLDRLKMSVSFLLMVTKSLNIQDISLNNLTFGSNIFISPYWVELRFM